ncbi:MAG: DUF2190 family protein [Baekduia sp.]
MTYSRPGAGTHLVNSTGAILTHGQPVSIGGISGIAIKQKATKWSDPFTAATQIQTGEKFWCITKGIVQVDSAPLTTPAKGDPVYIVVATNVLTKTVGSNVKFGRIVELPGDGRSVPAGKARIDLDMKDSF